MTMFRLAAGALLVALAATSIPKRAEAIALVSGTNVNLVVGDVTFTVKCLGMVTCPLAEIVAAGSSTGSAPAITVDKNGGGTLFAAGTTQDITLNVVATAANGRLISSFTTSWIATAPATLSTTSIGNAASTFGAISLAPAGATQTSQTVSFSPIVGPVGTKGGVFDVNNGTSGIVQNLTFMVGIPEPASLAMFGLAAGGLAMLRRRRRA